MNKLIFLPILFLTISGFSQDYIVKNDRDTIFCEIVKTKTNGLEFIQKSSDSIEYISLENYTQYFKSYKKIKYGISSGWSYRPIEIKNYPIGLKDYIENLKTGLNLGLSFSYSTHAVVSYGLKYNLFLSNNSLDNFNYVDSLGNPIKTGKVKNNIQIHYIGPTLSTRAPIGKRRFLIDISLGYLYYRENAIVVDPMIITGGTLGFNLNLQYEFPISDKLSIGLLGGVNLGTLQKLTYDYGDYSETYEFENPEEYESLIRYDLSLTFNFRK